MESNKDINNYDPRWFIWAITFLLLVGVGLTIYMLFEPQEQERVRDLPISVRNIPS